MSVRVCAHVWHCMCVCICERACAYMRAIVCEVSVEELGHCKPCISLMPCSACCLQPFNM